MSRIRAVVDALRRDVLSSRHSVTYLGARARHEAFCEHADFASVFDALSDDREESYPVREAITRALLEEHGRRPDGPWGGALTVAFFPMLSRLRHRIVGRTVSGDDLDQLIFACFTRALLEVLPTCDRLAMRLRQHTERKVFQFIRGERREHEGHVTYETDDVPDLASEPEPLPGEEFEQARDVLARLLVKAHTSPKIVDVLECTTLGQEGLRAYVKRTTGECDERAYQRLKRQRTRALSRMRELVQGEAANEVRGDSLQEMSRASCEARSRRCYRQAGTHVDHSHGA